MGTDTAQVEPVGAGARADGAVQSCVRAGVEVGEPPLLEPAPGGPAERFAAAVGPGHPVRVFLAAAVGGYVLLVGLMVALGLPPDAVLAAHRRRSRLGRAPEQVARRNTGRPSLSTSPGSARRSRAAS